MSKKLAMKVDHVSMKFNLSSEKVDNIKEYIIKGFTMDDERLKNLGGG